MTVNLKDSLNFALYKRVIGAYEGHTLHRNRKCHLNRWKRARLIHF